MKGFAITLVVVLLVLGGCSGLVLTGAASAADCGTPGASRTADITSLPDSFGKWNHDQVTMAAVLINAAAAMGVNTQAQTIVVMTAMGESSLGNPDHGDAVDNTTIGVLQQGTSYGPREDRLNPTKAATAFLTRLLGVQGWEQMEPTIAAHTVQINQDPYHYRPFWADAQAIVAALTQVAPGAVSCAAGGAVVLPLDPGYNMTEKYGYRGDIGLGTNSFHAAIDLAEIPGGSCGKPVYSSTAGQVKRVENAWTSIQSPDGYTVSYLHMALRDAAVAVGDQVTAGQLIGKIGTEGQSTGCHLDFRVDITGNTDPRLESIIPAAGAGTYIDPESFFAAFAVDVCPADWCRRNY